MNRLQKKCGIASAGFHLLLLLILFIGPAFLSSKNKFDSMPVLEFVPLATTDEMISGGGNRNATLPPPAPPPAVIQPPQPVPPPQPRIAPPEPQKETVKTSPETFATKTENNARKLTINTNLVTRPRDSKAASKQLSESDTEAKALAAARRRAAAQVSQAVRSLREGLSSGTEIDMPGPGTGGVPYANFYQAVQSVYARAWRGRVPDGATDKDTDVIASVTIARDGTVISAIVTRSSGNVVVDRAVQDVLERVKYAAPLPEGSTENERSVTIKFKVNIGQLAG
jgi:TonB family protein